MKLQQHLLEVEDQSNTSSVGADRGRLAEARQSTAALLAISDEAIRKALSSNSEAFLNANRQAGGQ